MGNKCINVHFPIRISNSYDDIRKYYKIGGILGSGSFGQVRECTHRESGEEYAVKVMDRKVKDKSVGRPSNEYMMKLEIDILKRLDHCNVIKFIEFFEDKHFFYAIIEKCDGGELFYQILKRRSFTEKDAAILSKDMLSALEYIHSLNVVHRDIKAENFLFKEKSSFSPLKLIDFGMSATIDDGVFLHDLCGSPHYVSPELIRKKYNYVADMWAFGVMMYLMLFGKYPFEGANLSIIAKEILNKNLDWDSEECSHLTKEAKDFMQQLLDRNYKKRLTATQALNHPWICEYGLKNIQSKHVIPNETLKLARRLSLEVEHVIPHPEVTAQRESKLLQLDEDFKKNS